MFNRIKNLLFVIAVVMVFTAQTYRLDDKTQQRAPASRPAPAARPQIQAPRVQAPRQAPPTRQAPRQVIQRAMPAEQPRQVQVSHQERQAPHAFVIVNQAPIENNRFLHRQHHNNWQPRYNFYDNQYHFYPYVNIASIVELAGGYVLVGPDGQNYFYEQGTFYLQDQTGQYVAVPPPVGIVVNPLAAGARQIIVNNQVFYRYKGVFYIQIAQGYQVIGPVQ